MKRKKLVKNEGWKVGRNNTNDDEEEKEEGFEYKNKGK
jgi:hypothetical protein